MKDYDLYILLLLGIVVFGALSLGVVNGIKKAFNSAPAIESSERKTKVNEQKRRMAELKERQRDLQERQKQFIRDHKR